MNNGLEDTLYIIKASELLTGFSDIDGDTLSITNLETSNGQLINNNDGTWILKTSQDFNGDVSLTYLVSDSNGGLINAKQSFSLAPVNDAPIISQAVDLGNVDEDNEIIFTRADLLANATDIDSNDLYVLNLSIDSGEGILN